MTMLRRPRAWILATAALALMQTLASAQTLDYFSMWNQGEPQQQVLQQIIDDFEEETGATVNVSWSGREVLTRARPRLLMGNPPDLVDQSFSELTGVLLARDELAVPLDDLLQGEGPEGQDTFISLFDETFMEPWRTNDHHYFVPYEFITSGFFYNKTIFEEYGIEEPETWDELMQVAATLQENGVTPFQQDMGNYVNYWYYWAVMRTMGPGALLEAAQDPTGETWSEPGYLEAAEMIEQVASQGYFQEGYEGSAFPAAQSSWGQGNGAMLLVGSWIVNEIAPSAVESWDPGYFPFPGAGQGINSMEAYLIGFAIPQGSDQVDLAKEFIRFALQEEYQQMIVEDAINIAARTDVAYPESLEIVRPHVQNAESFNQYFDAVRGLTPEWYSTVLTPTATELLTGEITAEAFIESMREQTTELLARE